MMVTRKSFVTEMLPPDDYRRKTTTLFESYSTHLLKLDRDFYSQYMQNTLQLNNKDKTFSEIAWYSGVAASDWSWGALMFDADNDGYRDIYVCNGVYQDVTDQDFINFFANDVIQKMALTGKKEEMDSIIKRMPSNPQLNSFFRNQGDLTFKEEGKKIGFDKPSFSNGAAYGDLDNDGDLDLIVNNLNQQSFVYKNLSSENTGNHYIGINLKGSDKNTFAIGSKVKVYLGDEILNFQMIPTRGFQSSVEYKMLFGLGQKNKIDSLEVIWPDNTKSSWLGLPVDTVLTLNYGETEKTIRQELNFAEGTSLLHEVNLENAPIHSENEYYDFFHEGLVIKMLSQEGPALAVGDVNGDGLDDYYYGGASGKAGSIQIQKNGRFEPLASADFESTSGYEDTAAEFFDIDGDGDLDLYVGSGGNHKQKEDLQLRDRIYTNDGKGNFSMNSSAVPPNGYNTSFVLPIDFDNDGDLDILVGSRSTPINYGVPPKNYLFENNGKGTFSDVSTTKAPILRTVGMLTDAVAGSFTSPDAKEILLTGEWMAPVILQCSKEGLKEVKTDLLQFPGWWYSAEAVDLDGDGDLDFVLGNRGENFYFTGDAENPVKLWLADMDKNGTIEKIITRRLDGKDMPVSMKKELTEQVVSLKKKNLKHTEYAKKSIQELFASEVLDKALVLKATWFKSSVAINEGNGKFTLKALPANSQFSCVCGIYCDDLNGDNRPELVIAGNDKGFMPQYSQLDANFGQVLLNDSSGQFKMVESPKSGFKVKGVVRKIKPISIGNQKGFIVGLNNDAPKIYTHN
ncbi:MAG: VCBS repeat-containing protein [Saprospiraceae bacterium]